MFKDTIIFGFLSGVFGNIPKTVLSWTFHFLGKLRYTFAHIAAGAFVGADFVDNPVALATGFISDWIMAGFIGVIILFFIRKTGHDYSIIKSVFISTILYVVFYGSLMALDITRASLLTPLPNLLLLFPHLLLGIGIGWFIKKYDRIKNYN